MQLHSTTLEGPEPQLTLRDPTSILDTHTSRKALPVGRVLTVNIVIQLVGRLQNFT